RESHRRRAAAVLGELRRIWPGLSLPLRFAARVADGFHKLLTRGLSDQRWQSAPAELQRAASKRLVCDYSLAHSSPPPRAPRRRSLIASSVPIQVRGPRFFRRSAWRWDRRKARAWWSRRPEPAWRQSIRKRF